MTDGYVASVALRAEARQLAERKLTGDRLREAKQFIYRSRRLEGEIGALMKRLESLPDAVVLDADRERVRALPASTIEQMRADRATGMKLQDLADRYGTSISSVSRFCSDVPVSR